MKCYKLGCKNIVHCTTGEYCICNTCALKMAENEIKEWKKFIKRIKEK